MSEQAPFRFRLRSVFLVVAVAALLSELSRFFLGLGESPIIVGLLCFAYGGMLGLLVFGFMGVLSVLSSRSFRGQGVALVVGAVVATGVWVGVIVSVTAAWVPVCALYSGLASALMYLATKSELAEQAVDNGSSEEMLRRLQKAKAAATAKVDVKGTPPAREE